MFHHGADTKFWTDGDFTGAVDNDVIDTHRSKVVKCTGPAGDACLMNSRLLHGSTPILSRQSRSLCISTYYAEKAQEEADNG